MSKVVLSLSGGMDSATLLGELLAQRYEVEAISFSYGSKHNQYEGKMAMELAQFYGIKLTKISLEGVFEGIKSNLMKGQGEIPEGHYEQENMSLTVVPGRNLVFSSILAAHAESIGASFIALGVHQGDHAIYPDCREEFISALDKTLSVGTDGKVGVLAPFYGVKKGDIIKRGVEIGVPYRMTRTCYKDQELSCGKCGSCVERLEGFAENNIKDPVTYEEENDT